MPLKKRTAAKILTLACKSAAFILILGIAAFLRFYGLNWDQGQYLHPDERFLAMVATSMKWPVSAAHYFDTDTSLLNPHNIGHSFYVYGTWPVIVQKFIAERLGTSAYGTIHLSSRFLSALTDMFTAGIVFLIAKRIIKYIRIQEKAAILFPYAAMFSYVFMLLPIQLSHFGTTDPYVTLFTTLTLFLLLFPFTIFTAACIGITTGLALSAKISAVTIVPVIALYILIQFGKNISHNYVKNNKKRLLPSLINIIIQYSIKGLILCLFLFLSFRITMPYFFLSGSLAIPNPRVIENITQLQLLSSPNAWFPPAIQWITTLPVVYPLLLLVLIGVGIPFTAASIAGIGALMSKKRFLSPLLYPVCFLFITFVYQSVQFAKPMRYMWPIYPSIAVLAGIGISFLFASGRIKQISITALLLFHILTAVSFMHIYTQKHPRVAASEWIYTYVPQGSALGYEHWDDPLPLNVPNYKGNGIYKGIELTMFYEDSQQKWKELWNNLNSVDYLILSSNRAYGSLTSVPDQFPLTASYYEDLFSGRLPFRKVAQFSSRPTLPVPFLHICVPLPFFRYGSIDQNRETAQQCNGLVFIDDYVEESWTVYDHPKVTIFKRVP